PAIGLSQNRDCFGRSLYRTRPAYSNAPNPRQNQRSVIKTRAAIPPYLGIGQAVIAVATTAAGIPWRLAGLYSAKESTIGTFSAQYHILQYLCIDLRIFWQSFFDTWQFSFPLVVANRDAAHPPCRTPLTNGGIVDMATEHQGAIRQ